MVKQIDYNSCTNSEQGSGTNQTPTFKQAIRAHGNMMEPSKPKKGGYKGWAQKEKEKKTSERNGGKGDRNQNKTRSTTMWLRGG